MQSKVVSRRLESGPSKAIAVGIAKWSEKNVEEDFIICFLPKPLKLHYEEKAVVSPILAVPGDVEVEVIKIDEAAKFGPRLSLIFSMKFFLVFFFTAIGEKSRQSRGINVTC